MTTPPHLAALNIPHLQRIAAFSSRDPKKLISFASVCSTWRETIVRYSTDTLVRLLAVNSDKSFRPYRSGNGTPLAAQLFLHRVARYCYPDLVDALLVAVKKSPLSSRRLLKQTIGHRCLFIEHLAASNLRSTTLHGDGDDGEPVVHTVFGVVAHHLNALFFQQPSANDTAAAAAAAASSTNRQPHRHTTRGDKFHHTVLDAAVKAGNVDAVKTICRWLRDDKNNNSKQTLLVAHDLYMPPHVSTRNIPTGYMYERRGNASWRQYPQFQFLNDSSPRYTMLGRDGWHTLLLAADLDPTVHDPERVIVPIFDTLLSLHRGGGTDIVGVREALRASSVDRTTPLHCAFHHANLPLIKYIMKENEVADHRIELLTARDLRRRPPPFLLFPEVVFCHRSDRDDRVRPFQLESEKQTICAAGATKMRRALDVLRFLLSPANRELLDAFSARRKESGSSGRYFSNKRSFRSAFFWGDTILLRAERAWLALLDTSCRGRPCRALRGTGAAAAAAAESSSSSSGASDLLEHIQNLAGDAFKMLLQSGHFTGMQNAIGTNTLSMIVTYRARGDDATNIKLEVLHFIAMELKKSQDSEALVADLGHKQTVMPMNPRRPLIPNCYNRRERSKSRLTVAGLLNERGDHVSAALENAIMELIDKKKGCLN